jgi:hypothetical protein
MDSSRDFEGLKTYNFLNTCLNGENDVCISIYVIFK